MPSLSTQYRLTRYPDGPGLDGVWSRTETTLPELEDDQVRVRMSHISVDPGMRGWMTPKRSYMPPVALGEVMRAFGVGEVLESRSATLKAGDWVTGFTGVQTEGNLPASGLRPIRPELAPARHYLSGLGMTGYTAYFGLTDVGAPKAGETVVVSAAAGAVGSIAAQIAKIIGCRVIGIAGGAEKSAFLRDELKLDAAIDYKNENIAERLTALAPDGIDVYFDNVGGETLDAVLGRINRHGRIVVCGGISQYGDMGAVRGPSNYLQLTAQSARMQGFTMRDYMHRVPEAFQTLIGWQRSSQLQFREHIVRGIDRFPEAFGMLFTGANKGKLLIEL